MVLQLASTWQLGLALGLVVTSGLLLVSHLLPLVAARPLAVVLAGPSKVAT
jgi:hypothetical protein